MWIMWVLSYTPINESVVFCWVFRHDDITKSLFYTFSYLTVVDGFKMKGSLGILNPDAIIIIMHWVHKFD